MIFLHNRTFDSDNELIDSEADMTGMLDVEWTLNSIHLGTRLGSFYNTSLLLLNNRCIYSYKKNKCPSVQESLNRYNYDYCVSKFDFSTEK